MHPVLLFISTIRCTNDLTLDHPREDSVEGSENLISLKDLLGIFLSKCLLANLLFG